MNTSRRLGQDLYPSHCKCCLIKLEQQPRTKLVSCRVSVMLMLPLLACLACISDDIGLDCCPVRRLSRRVTVSIKPLQYHEP